MELQERFLSLVQHQLSGFESQREVKQLVVYVAQSREGQAPSLEPIGHWPRSEKVLPPVEADRELRKPSPDRRWYPLQEGPILLGVLRAERISLDSDWSEALDQTLQKSASALAHCISLELERRKLLEELNQNREQISLMVHQLRNPLAALRTYAQLLLRKLDPESSYRTLVEGMLTEQEQINRYVCALDELSQVQLPSQSMPLKRLLLPPVISKEGSINVQSMLQPLIDRAEATANLQGRTWHSPTKWPSWSLEERPQEYGVIPEIVANLLENAFRYSSKKSPIGLFLEENGLCVWDGGPSIAFDERERIFQKRIRGKGTIGEQGSGLGLALGRELSEQLGGDLKLIIPPSLVDSKLPNEGNAFYLTLRTKSTQRIEE